MLYLHICLDGILLYLGSLISDQWDISVRSVWYYLLHFLFSSNLKFLLVS